VEIKQQQQAYAASRNPLSRGRRLSVAEPIEHLIDDGFQIAVVDEKEEVGGRVAGDGGHVGEVVVDVDYDRQHRDVVGLDQLGLGHCPRRVDGRVAVADQYADVGDVGSVPGTEEHPGPHLIQGRLQHTSAARLAHII